MPPLYRRTVFALLRAWEPSRKMIDRAALRSSALAEQQLIWDARYNCGWRRCKPSDGCGRSNVPSPRDRFPHQTPPRPEPMPGALAPADDWLASGAGAAAADAAEASAVPATPMTEYASSGSSPGLKASKIVVSGSVPLARSPVFKLTRTSLRPGGIRNGAAGLSASASLTKSPKIGAAMAPPVLPLPIGFGVS